MKKKKKNSTWVSIDVHGSLKHLAVKKIWIHGGKVCSAEVWERGGHLDGGGCPDTEVVISSKQRLLIDRVLVDIAGGHSWGFSGRGVGGSLV